MKKQLKEFKNFVNIETYAKSVDETLLAGKDFNYKDRLIVKHGDGTELHLAYFKLEKVKTDFNNEIVYIIYTEHHRTFIYSKSDLRETPKIEKNFRKK